MDKIVLSINNFEELDEVLQVAEDVFQPNDEEKEKYHQKSKWLERVKNGLLVSASVNSKIVGFAVCYRKQNDLHIWNVGVLDKYRKIGVWRQIYNAIVEFALANNFDSLTLNTYKKQFPGMYNFVQKEGFEEYQTEFDELSQDTKSMFIKKL